MNVLDPQVSVSDSVDQKVTVKIGKGSGKIAPRELLGSNLEMAASVNKAMLSERLENPKFCGPANPQTGLAPGWQPIGNNMGNVQNALVQGMFLSGNESQLVNSYSGIGVGLIQTGRRVWKGEELEVEIWAKVRHHPVTLEFSIRPLPSRAIEYSKAEITIDASYWKRYTVRLSSSCDDENATFMIMFQTRGVVLFDQIHLRPVGEPNLSREVLQRIGEMNIPLLRFPGGCMSTNYHWRLGTGPVHLRPSLPDPVFKVRADYDFGTEEYLEMCHQHGIRPYITINIGSETVENAADWARYCAEWYRARSIELPEIYFQIGNEQYGIWETSHMSAPMYLEAVRAFVPAIRENYPKAVIIGPAEPLCSGIAGFEDTPLRELLLKEASGLIDVFALNRYKGQWYTDPVEQVINAADSVRKIEDDFSELLADCNRLGVKPRLALPEWNYWLHASHWDGKDFFEPDDALHGIFVSGMFHMMARMAPYIELAAYEHLINAMGLIHNRGGKVIETSISQIFSLYEAALPGEVLDLQIDSGEIADGIAQVDVLVIRQGGGIWLFACNRSWEKEVLLEVEEAGCPTEVHLMVASDCYQPLEKQESMGKLALPPLSVVRVRYEG